ncbi:hypothetical protein [Ensifer adhaerens]|uniref:hypothetical protein n=1 Tax=Ensifer adhaerens TaxID=106592 RepID=UPI00098EAFE1|nr:hypothetical protein [Ensifer adhaerens]
MATRKEIAERVIAKWQARGIAIDHAGEFQALLRLWIAGDISIDDIRRRYLKLLRERYRTAKRN